MEHIYIYICICIYIYKCLSHSHYNGFETFGASKTCKSSSPGARICHENYVNTKTTGDLARSITSSSAFISLSVSKKSRWVQITTTFAISNREIIELQTQCVLSQNDWAGKCLKISWRNNSLASEICYYITVLLWMLNKLNQSINAESFLSYGGRDLLFLPSKWSYRHMNRNVIAWSLLQFCSNSLEKYLPDKTYNAIGISLGANETRTVPKWPGYLEGYVMGIRVVWK